MSDLRPNGFHVPNFYVDKLWHLLTPDEKTVLVYLCRRIFGFADKDGQDNISMSQLTDGIVTRAGKRLDHGTGLSKAGNRNALAGLIEHGLIKIVKPADFGNRIAARYELQVDALRVDIEKLERRQEEKLERGRQRTGKARVTFLMSGGCPTTPARGLVDNPHNTQTVPITNSSTEYVESSTVQFPTWQETTDGQEYDDYDDIDL